MKRIQEAAYSRSRRRMECRWARWICPSSKMKRRLASRANLISNFIMGAIKIIKNRTDSRRRLLQLPMLMVRISKVLQMKMREQTLRRCHTQRWGWLHSLSIITQTIRAIMGRVSQWAWARLMIKKREMSKTLASVAKNVAKI